MSLYRKKIWKGKKIKQEEYKLVREEALKLRRPLTEEEVDMMYKAYSNEKQREGSKGLGTRFDYEQEEDCDYEQEEDDYEMER